MVLYSRQLVPLPWVENPVPPGGVHLYQILFSWDPIAENVVFQLSDLLESLLVEVEVDMPAHQS